MTEAASLDGRWTAHTGIGDLQAAAPIADWVNAVADDLRLPQRQGYALQLCSEELLTNAIRHGRRDDAGLSLRVGIRVDGRELRLIFEDDGLPFDPTVVPDRPSPDGAIEARVGGHGLTLIRHFAQTVRYARVGDRNRTEVSFAVA